LSFWTIALDVYDRLVVNCERALEMVMEEVAKEMRVALARLEMEIVGECL
jgi:hypothetical protein